MYHQRMINTICLTDFRNHNMCRINTFGRRNVIITGPNGAGKTTIFNMLTGVYKPDDGLILLDGEEITGKSTIDINKAGIATKGTTSAMKIETIIFHDSLFKNKDLTYETICFQIVNNPLFRTNSYIYVLLFRIWARKV